MTELNIVEYPCELLLLNSNFILRCDMRQFKSNQTPDIIHVIRYHLTMNGRVITIRMEMARAVNGRYDHTIYYLFLGA